MVAGLPAAALSPRQGRLGRYRSAREGSAARAEPSPTRTVAPLHVPRRLRSPGDHQWLQRGRGARVTAARARGVVDRSVATPVVAIRALLRLAARFHARSR